MRRITSALLAISFIAVIGSFTAFGQSNGLRVEADIPFDFTVGKKTFSSGNYKLVLTRFQNTVYTASLYDGDGKFVLRTTAIRNGSVVNNKSDMVFAVNEGGHFLEKLRTPDMGFQFGVWKSDSLLAKSEKVSVPTNGSPQ